MAEILSDVSERLANVRENLKGWGRHGNDIGEKLAYGGPSLACVREPKAYVRELLADARELLADVREPKAYVRELLADVVDLLRGDSRRELQTYTSSRSPTRQRAPSSFPH